MTPQSSATPEEVAAWLRLTRAAGIDEAAIRLLLGEIGLPSLILASSHAALARRVGTHCASALKDEESVADLIDATAKWLAQGGRYVVSIADGAYPPQLLAAPAPPFVLFASGRIDTLGAQRLAIVAPKNASAAAIDTATRFAAELARRGVALVTEFGSPYAESLIKAVLAIKGADLIALLPRGPDRIAPASQVDLARRLAKEHTLLAQHAPGEAEKVESRLQPGSLLIGMACALLVVEAPLRSPVLATARLAAEAGREVLAIPGSIHSPLAKGCHKLIREGAKLVDSIDDIVEEIQRLPPVQAHTSPLS